jgi:DNA (cytosine-5)-methyltransferase 1
MDAPVMLCGSTFGLNVRRHRFFESNFSFLTPPCMHHLVPEPMEVCGWLSGPSPKHRKPNGIAEARTAMGIDWMDDGEIQLAIPPAYSEYIARQIR